MVRYEDLLLPVSHSEKNLVSALVTDLCASSIGMQYLYEIREIAHVAIERLQLPNGMELIPQFGFLRTVRNKCLYLFEFLFAACFKSA